MTVNGTLYFPLDMTTKLTFGHVDMTIGATGSLITSSDGTVGNIGVVDDTFTCSVIWNTTSDNAKGMIITNGAYVDIRGDSALYGGTHSTTLFANWTSGQTLTAVGTAPRLWLAGQTFTIARNTSTGVATTLRYTIASVLANGSNTDITISEAAPAISFIADGQIENEARNVKIYKLGAEIPAMDTAYTNRPWIDDNHVTGTVKWRDMQVTGFYWYDGANLQTSGTLTFDNCIFRNGYRVIYRLSNAVLTGCNAYSNSSYGFYTLTTCTLTSCNAYSNSAGFYTLTTCTLTSCNAYSNSSAGFYILTTCTLTSCNAYSNDAYGFYGLTTCTLTSCNAYSNSAGFITSTTCTLTSCNAYSNISAGFITLTTCTLTSCNAYSNSSGFRQCQLRMVNGSIGWNGLVSAPNTSDFVLPSEIRTRNVKWPQAGYVYTSRNTNGVRGGVIFDNLNQSSGAWRFDGPFSTHTKVANPVVGGFMSGDGSCIKIEPLSNISATNYTWGLGGYLKSQEEGLAIYVPARQVTIKCRVQSHAFDTLPTNSQLYLEVLYYADATTTMTTVVSTETIAANDTTKVLSVTITPNRASKAYVRLVFTGPYDADGYILVDPCVNW
jgi:hypothetical protein